MFIAVLDYKNLDNPLFLKSFAEVLNKMPKSNSFIIHSDSDYTNRIIQTGVMREEATIRSIKDINHRVVTFLADYGIACIGINGYQRDMIVSNNGEIIINQSLINRIPPKTIVVLSNLIKRESGELHACPLPVLTKKLSEALGLGTIFIFSTAASSHVFTKSGNSEAEILTFSDFSKKNYFMELPDEFKSANITFNFSNPLYNNNLKSFYITNKVIADNDNLV